MVSLVEERFVCYNSRFVWLRETFPECLFVGGGVYENLTAEAGL